MELNALFGAPTTDWHELIARYIAYVQTKTWRGRTHKPDGTEIANCLGSSEASRLAEKLQGTVMSLVDREVLLGIAHPIDQDRIDKILSTIGHTGRRFDRCPRWLWHLWRAIVLNRDGYTCRYCGRTAWQVYAEQERTLRFELDHSRAKSRLDVRDDFEVGNIVAACRSCNVMKGQMEETAFLAELESLAKSFVRRRALTCRSS
jgi:hypothetical protein